MQNLRARAYDPANGRFIGLDPFAGNMQDPQSLHKYAYVHGDPIQGIDPTGLSTLIGQVNVSAIAGQLNSIEGNLGKSISEAVLAVAAGATAFQAIAFIVVFDLAGLGIPFLGNAFGKVVNSFGQGIGQIGKFLPLLQNGKLALPGILNLTSKNTVRYIDELFDPALLKNAGDSAALRRNLSEMHGLSRTAMDSVADLRAHHLIPASLKDHPLLQALNFNIDAALNAMPLVKGKHGWSKPHSGYNQAVEEILNKIQASGVNDATKREMIIETIANATATILDGASLKNEVGNFLKKDWLDAITPLRL